MVSTFLKQFVVVMAIIIVMFVGAVLLNLNFSSSKFNSGDIFFMLSSWFWIYLLLLPIFLFIMVKLDKRFSLAIPFSLVSIFCIFFQLVQYPKIFYPDTFFHASIAKYILSKGFSADIEYLQYPGAFILLSVVSEILGLPLIESSLFLAAFFILMITLLLLIIGRIVARRINISLETSWITPVIFFAFNFSFYNADHYSPQLMGLMVFILILYLFQKIVTSKNRRWVLLFLIFFSSLITIHVFSSATTLACALCIYLAATRKLHFRNKSIGTLTTFMATLVLFILWQTFFAIETFRNVCAHIFFVFTGQKPIIITRGLIMEPLFGPYTYFLNMYRYGIYAFFGLMSFLGILKFWYRIESRLVLLLGLGVICGALMLHLTPATFGVGRILHYGGVIVAISSSLWLIENKRKFFRYFFKALTMILPFFMIATFLVSNAYYSTYTSFIHIDEMKAAEFVAKTVRNQILVEIRSDPIVQFYGNLSIPTSIIDFRVDNSSVAKTKIQKSNLNLQYLPRLLLYFNLSFVENEKSNLIYSNGLNRVYTKVNATIER